MLERIDYPSSQVAAFALECPSPQCRNSGAFPFLEEGYSTDTLRCPNCHTQYRATITHVRIGGSGCSSTIQLREEK